VKVAWLTKIIDFVSAQSGSPVTANPKKIIAGLEPENTNQFLQLLGKTAGNAKAKPANKEEKPKESKSKPKKEKTKEAPSAEDAPPKKEKKSGEEKKPKSKESKDGAKKPSDGTKKKDPSSKTKSGSDGTKKKKEGSTDTKKKSSSKTKDKDKETKEVPKKTKAAPVSQPQSFATEEKAPEIEPVEEDPEVKKVEKDLGTDSLIKQTMRPQTARPAPPRIQSNVRTVEKVEVEVANPVKQARVVIEEGSAEEDDEPSGVLDDDEDKENHSNQSQSDLSNPNATSDETREDQQQHGGLVRDIIAATKSLDTVRLPIHIE
jgi:TRAF3-interacting protein 1